MASKLKQLDAIILLIVACFGVISTMVIYSATAVTKFHGLHINNAVLYCVLFVVMIVLSFIDYRDLGKVSPWLYGFGIVLLLYVRLKGMDINGSRRWINLHVMQFQPSELTKVFVILFIAQFLKKREGEFLRIGPDLLPLFVIIAVPFLFVLMQPDLGTSMVFVCIFVGMLWVGNIKKLHAILGVLGFAAIVGILILLYQYDFSLFSKIIHPHQLARIQAFLDPTADPNTSYHVRNAMIGIASGGFTGEGFLHGNMIQGGFIPYDYADSIFVVIGEEFGFLGSAALLLLYFILIYRLINIAFSCKNLLGRYIIIGIVSMLALQVFENIAMHTGLMPLTGIALPFISYGGSSLLTDMLSMAIALSVKIHDNEPEAQLFNESV